MSNESNQMTNWDHFTGQWLRTVRALRRDSNYCRLALAMALADEQREDWPYYLSLAQTWKGIHEDRDHVSMQTRCAAMCAKGWSICVLPDGKWFAQATGIEGTTPRLADLLRWLERSGQPLREDWAATWERIAAARVKAVSQ